jgi:hypothetical protein
MRRLITFVVLLAGLSLTACTPSTPSAPSGNVPDEPDQDMPGDSPRGSNSAVSCDAIGDGCRDMCYSEIDTSRPCGSSPRDNCLGTMCANARTACLKYRVEGIGRCDLSTDCNAYCHNNAGCMKKNSTDNCYETCTWMKNMCSQSTDEEARLRRCHDCEATFDRKWNGGCGAQCSYSTDFDDPCCDAAENAYHKCRDDNNCR